VPKPVRWSRRRFALVLGAAAAAAGCGPVLGLAGTSSGFAERLRARPGKPATGAPAPAAGQRKLGLRDTGDAILHVPPGTTSPTPLLVLLHGAGGSGERMLTRVGMFSDEAGIPVLALSSEGRTWDAIRGTFGADAEHIDAALDATFARLPIDPARVVIGGFSDGATYALSLGLINGDLFHKVIAFSPGFLIESEPYGHPAVFLSHGRRDDILPFDRCGARLATLLKDEGYALTFRAFDGGHEIPPAIARDAMAWIKK
jgi:predicted esterase